MPGDILYESSCVFSNRLVFFVVSFEAYFLFITVGETNQFGQPVELFLRGRLCEFDEMSACTAAHSYVAAVHELSDIDIAASGRFQFAGFEEVFDFMMVDVPLMAFV